MSEKEGLSFEKVWAMFQETDRQIKETDRQIKETSEQMKETDHQMKETDRRFKEAEWRMSKFDERMSRFGDQLGYFGRSLGEVSELLVVPGLCKKMNALGHGFTRMGPNKIYSRENGKTLTEVDLMLDNSEEAMAVEIKTDLSVKWVSKHLNRLELLRKNENVSGVKGKVLYGAVAGITIDEDARDLALEKGMYVVQLMDDDEKLEVMAPEEVHVGRW